MKKENENKKERSKKESEKPRWPLTELLIFYHVIKKNKKTAQKLISTILKKEVAEMEFNETLNAVSDDSETRYIPLDVCFENDNNMHHVVIGSCPTDDIGRYYRYVLGALDEHTIRTSRPKDLINTHFIFLYDKVDDLDGKILEAEPMRTFEMVQTNNPACYIGNVPKLNTKVQLKVCDVSAYAKIDKNDALYDLFRYISTGKINPDNSFIKGLDKAVRCANEDPKITKFFLETRPNLQNDSAQRMMTFLTRATAESLQENLKECKFALSYERVGKFEKIIKVLESYPKEDREVVEPEGSC